MLRDESAGRAGPTPWDFSHSESGVSYWPWGKGIIPASGDVCMSKP